MINPEEFPASETARELMGSVTQGWYDRSYVGKWLFEVMGQSLEEVKKRFEELPLQVFAETATWGLAYHEQKYGLPVREDFGYEKRRGLIAEKRGARPPATPYAMEQLVNEAVGFPIYVADINDPAYPEACASLNKEKGPHEFFVLMLGEGTADIRGIRRVLDRMKQSHTVYDMAYFKRYQYRVPAACGNTVHFQVSFYPRFNQAYLYLDRSWKLDGGQFLNGYDSGTLLDFYPVGLRIQTEAWEMVKEALDLRIPLTAAEVIHTENSLLIRMRAEEEAASGERVRLRAIAREDARTQESMKLTFCARETTATGNRLKYQSTARADPCRAERVEIRTGAAEEVRMGSVQVLVENQMDQTWKLDSSRKLNGGLSIL